MSLTYQYTCDECGKYVSEPIEIIQATWREPNYDDRANSSYSSADICSWSCLAAFAAKKASA